MSRRRPAAYPAPSRWFLRRPALLLLLALVAVLFATLSASSPALSQDGPQPPAAPRELEVSTKAGSLDVEVDWDDVEGATRYLVRWRTADQGGKLNEGEEVSVSGAEITVEDFGTWVVRVQACNDAGCGKPTAEKFEVEPEPEAESTPEPDAESTPEPEPIADTENAQAQAELSVSVRASSTTPFAGDEVTFRAAITGAPAGEQPTYQWELGHGGDFWLPAGSDATFSYLAHQPETASVRVTVTYPSGATATSDPRSVTWRAFLPRPELPSNERTRTATDPVSVSIRFDEDAAGLFQPARLVAVVSNLPQGEQPRYRWEMNLGGAWRAVGTGPEFPWSTLLAETARFRVTVFYGSDGAVTSDELELAWAGDRATREVTGAQTSTILISNSGQTSTSSRGLGRDWGQAFTTGSSSGGYKLTSVQINFAAAGSLSGYAVRILNDDGSGSPGTEVGTLNTLSAVTVGLNEFTGDVDLDAGTTYYVVFDMTTNSTVPWRTTDSDDEDTGGAAGWSIGDVGHHRSRDNSGTWAPEPSDRSMLIVVKGYAKSVDTTVPTLESAAVDGTSLRLNYNEALDTGSTPAVGSFAVDLAGSGQTPTGVAVSGQTVTLTLGTAATAGQTVTLTYTKPGTNPIQDLAGNDADTISNRTITNVTGDSTVPTVSSATVDGTELVVTFNEALDTASTPATTDFTVSVAGTDKTPSAVEVSGSAVTLTLATADAVTAGQTVTVSYTKGTNPIQDLAGNDAAALNTQSVTNNTSGPDTTAPTVSGAPSVTSAAGSDNTYAIGDTISVKVTFSENVTVTGTPQLEIAVGANNRQANYASGSGTTALTFSYTVVAGDADSDGIAVTANKLTLNSGTIQDAAGNNATLTHTALAAQSSHKVDGVAPTFDSATVNGTSLVITFSESMNTAATARPVSSVFRVTATPSGGAARNIDGSNTAVTVNGAAVTVTLSSAVVHGETVTVAYRGIALAAQKKVQDLAGNNLADFAGGAVTNTTPDTTVPTFSSATVDGTALELNYNEALDTTSTPATTDFTVSVAGTDQTPSVVVVSGQTVTLTLGTAATPGQAVTVSYTKGTNPIQDVAGNDAAALSTQSVTNNTALVANYNEKPSTSTFTFNRDIAQAFTTGSNSAGYTLTSVAVGMRVTSVVEPNYSVFIHEDSADSPGEPAATSLGELTTTATLLLNFALVQFDASGNGISLDASTKYWLVIDMAGVADMEYRATASDNEDSGGAAGWTIADTHLQRSIQSTTWVATNQNTVWMRVNGTVNADTTKPTVSGAPSVTSNAGTDNTYAIGDTISVRVTFDEVVTVTGTPQLEIAVGSNNRQADYASGSASTELTFSYTVASGDSDGDGIAVAADKLTLNSGTIQDAAGNNAVLTHVTLAAQSSHKVDGVVPTVLSATVKSTSLVITFSETLGTAASLANSAFTVKKTPQSGSETTVNLSSIAPSISGDTVTLTLGAAVVATDTGVKVTYAKPSMGTNNKLKDAAGNEAANFTDQAVTITANIAPVFSATTLTRSIAENTAANTNVGAGIPAATDTDGDTLTYTMEGTDAASFTFDASTRQIKTKTGVTYDYETKSSYSVTIKADDGNGGTDTVAVTISLTDANEPPAAPTAPTVVATSGSHSSLDVSWMAPTNTGPAITDYDVQYQASSETTWTSHSFTGAGTSTMISSLTANTTYNVRVKATKAEGSSGWSPSGSGKTAADTTAPTISGAPSVTSDSGSDSTYNLGDTISVKVTFNEIVTVTGTPQLEITVGSNNRQANYASGTGTTELTFSYTVVSGDADTDGISVGANKLTLNSGTIQDGAGNSATLTHTALGTQSGHKVDGIDKTVPTLDSATVNGTTLTLNYSEALDTNSTPATTDFTVSVAGTDQTPTGVVVSGSAVTLTLGTAATAGQAVTVTYTVPATNPIQDLAGNDAAALSSQAVTNNTPAPPRVSQPSFGGFPGGGGGGPSPSTIDYEWTVKHDIEALTRGNDAPTGMWSDGTTIWLADNGQGADDEVYAYDLVTGERVDAREFALDSTNRAPRGFWSNGETVWVSDSGRDHVFAYDLAAGGRLEAREIALETVNRDARGIWSDGETLWVLDGRANALFAYHLVSGRLLAHYELDSRNGDPRGTWSDGTTVWVSDHGAKILFAYRLPEPPEDEEQAVDAGEVQAASNHLPEPVPLERVRDEEFTHLSSSSNNSPRGIWSDGVVMYVTDQSDGRVYTYNMPDAIDARLASLELEGVDIGEFDPASWEYEGTVGPDITVTTVAAEAMQRGTTVVIEPPDADEEMDGHQVALDGVDAVTVTVTSADGSRTRVYRVQLAAASCLLGAVGEGFSLVVHEGGTVDELDACARDRSVVALYALHEGSYVPYYPDAPAFVNEAFTALYADGVPALTPLVAASEGPPSGSPALAVDDAEPSWPECLPGSIPSGYSAAVYEGGSIEDLATCASGRNVAALYALHSGDWVPYVVDGTEAENQPFVDLFPGGLPAITPLVVRSDGPPPGTAAGSGGDN